MALLVCCGAYYQKPLKHLEQIRFSQWKDHPNIRGKDEVKVGFLWGELGRKRKEAAE